MNHGELDNYTFTLLNVLMDVLIVMEIEKKIVKFLMMLNSIIAHWLEISVQKMLGVGILLEDNSNNQAHNVELLRCQEDITYLELILLFQDYSKIFLLITYLELNSLCIRLILGIMKISQSMLMEEKLSEDNSITQQDHNYVEI